MGKRDSGHVRAQREGKVRDNHTCQICGSTGHTQGHHIVDVQFGGAASKDNIVTLCPECHKRAHKGLLQIFLG